MRWVLVAMMATTGCGDNLSPDDPYFASPGQREVGAFSIDELRASDVPMRARVAFAREDHVTVLFYGHLRPNRTSPATIDALLSTAEANGLETVTFADLAAGTVSGPALCLSFDDTEVDAWHDQVLPILRAHHAHASFFVTKFPELTADQRDKLHELYDEGNSIEAHGLHHLYAREYLKQHDVDSYVRDEVTPSFELLEADGFAPVAFAYPGGSHTEELDNAVLAKYALIRTISGHAH